MTAEETNRQTLRDNIRLMMSMNDSVPTAEIHECINQLEEILVKRHEKFIAEKKEPGTDNTTVFYLKIMKCLWIASFAEDRLVKMQRRMEHCNTLTSVYRTLYSELEREYRKYEVVADLIQTDELENYIQQTQAALNLNRTKSNPITQQPEL